MERIRCMEIAAMTRQQLWDRMKKAGITHSKRLDCPPDGDLKVVFACCQVSAKGMVDFLCGLDGKVDGKRE